MSCEGDKISEEPVRRKGPFNIRRAVDQLGRIMATGYYTSETGGRIYRQPYSEEFVPGPGDKLIGTYVTNLDDHTRKFERASQLDQPQDEKL